MPLCAAAGAALSAPMTTNANAPARTLVPRTIRCLQVRTPPLNNTLWADSYHDHPTAREEQSIRWAWSALQRAIYFRRNQRASRTNPTSSGDQPERREGGMGRRAMDMRTLRYMVLRSAITFVVSGCFSGAGSGLIGITGGGGGGGSGAPPVLGFFVQPGTADEGQTMSPVEVVATDSLGSTDSTFTGAITISLTSNSTGAALSGTTTQRAAARRLQWTDPDRPRQRTRG